VLPDDIAARVLERLRRERAGALGLDALLDASPAPAIPADLAARVLSVVAPLLAPLRSTTRDGALDRLLDRVPEPVSPPALVQDIIEGTRAARDASRRGARVLRVRRSATIWAAVAAAVLVAVLWFTRDGAGEVSPRPDVVDLGPAPSVAEVVPGSSDGLTAELVEAFDVLDNWEYLGGDDLDLLLASIDELEALVLEESVWEDDSGG
jgi:hypothetical protein